MSNIDHSEVQKFDTIAARWWDTQGDMKPLHDINPLRTRFITELVNVAELSVLDVGCGGGILTETLAALGARTTGIDMSEAALKVAKMHAAENGLTIHYQQTTVEEFALQHAGTFDVITCMEMLEHVPDPASVITACATLLKPQGKLFLSTLNRNIKSYVQAIVGAEYILKLLPKGTHDYQKFIRPSELDKCLRDAQVKLMKLEGMTYNPFTKTFKRCSDISVNYLAYAEKLHD